MRSTTVGVNARAKAIQPCGWPVPVLSKIGRTANSAGPRARCTMPRTLSVLLLSWPEVTACLMAASSSGSGGISYSCAAVASSASDARVSRLRSSTRKVSTSSRTSAPALSDFGQEIRPIAARELRGLVPDRVVAHGRIQVVELGGEAALQLLALHVDVARLDVGDVGQPAALRPAVEHHENDGDHRADHGQRRLPDPRFRFRIAGAGHNVNCVTCVFWPLQSVPGAPRCPASNRAQFPVNNEVSERQHGRQSAPTRNDEAPAPASGAGASAVVVTRRPDYRLRRKPAKICRPVLEYCVTSGSSSYAQRSSVWLVRFRPSIENDR